MVLEPLSAFSVACNVLQIIEFGSKVLSNAIDYRKAANGTLPEHQDLRNILQSLKNLNAELQASMPQLGGSQALSTAETRLLEANAECLRLSNEFIDLLDRLKVKSWNARLESLRMSVKSLWYKEKVESMEDALSQARDNLNVAFLVYMNSKQATISSQNDILKSTTRVEGSILNAVTSSSGDALRIPYIKSGFSRKPIRPVELHSYSAQRFASPCRRTSGSRCPAKNFGQPPILSNSGTQTSDPRSAQGNLSMDLAVRAQSKPAMG